MKKMIFIFVFTLITSLSLQPQNSSATDLSATKSSKTTSTTKNPTKKELTDLEKKYNMKLTTPPSKKNVSKNLTFKNVEEFEKYLKSPKNNTSIKSENLSNNIYMKNTKTLSKYSITKTSSKTRKKYKKVSWWSPLNGPVMGVLSMKNIDFNFHIKKNKKKKWELYKVTGIDSWQTGYHDVKWQHRKGSYIITGKKTIQVKAKGLYTLGVVIGNQPVGYSWNGTWTKNVKVSF